MILAEMVDEARRLSAKIDAGVQALTVAASKAAHAEHEYRLEKARQWMTVREGTVPERQAQVDGACADLRLVRDLAEAERMAALEALRSRRAQLSALQSLAAAHRAEAEHGRYGTQDTP